MYEKHFRLSQRPFVPAPLVDRYFPGQSIEAARATLDRCVRRAEGVGLLVGAAGTGKSLVCQLLAETFRGEYAVALLANGHLTSRRDLLQAILFELGLPYRDLDEGELRLSLIDFLAPSQDCPQGLLLVLDEAHSLPTRLLEEVRMITNLVRNGQPRVRLVLAGNGSLEERFASPKLESFQQRIAARCYLEPLARGETAAYVAAQVEKCGGHAGSLFAPGAIEEVYRATGGVPRLVNQVCDHALMLAYAAGATQVTKAGIEEAWSDLQQLPTPWAETPAATAAASEGVIEFGTLEDLDDADDEPAIVEFVTRPTPEAAAVKLDQIESHLSALEHGFEVVGTTGTEAEVIVPNPFEEPFHDEEVVVDRYAAFDHGYWAQRTPVYSAEGHVLTALLSPYLRAESSVAVASPTGESSGRAAKAAAAAERTTALHTATIEVAAADPYAVEASEDADLMIVEDDPAPVPVAAQPASSSGVRRQEFGQLFARLRRG